MARYHRVEDVIHLALALQVPGRGLCLEDIQQRFQVGRRTEERMREDTPRNRERVRRSRNKYANYLIERATGTMADFVTVGKVRQVDPWLQIIVDLVNEALSMLPTDPENLVKLEHVIDRFDAVRQGIRTFPLPSEMPKREMPLPTFEPCRTGRRPRSRRRTRGGRRRRCRSTTSSPASRAASCSYCSGPWVSSC